VESCTGHEVADDIDRVGVAANFVNTDDIRMLKLGHRPGLTQELLRFALIELSLPWDLHRDQPIELGIACFPHTAKRPRTDLFDQIEVADRPHLFRHIRYSAIAEQAKT